MQNNDYKAEIEVINIEKNLLAQQKTKSRQTPNVFAIVRVRDLSRIVQLRIKINKHR